MIHFIDKHTLEHKRSAALTVHKCTKIFWHDQPYQRWVKNQHAGGGIPLWPMGKLAQLVMSLPLDGWLN